jgi:LacI family transcriptional regulator
LDQGVRIPEDLAVIGCGNLHYDDALSVPLSSINQHSRRIGQEAARIALGILNSKVSPKLENVVMQPELVVRRSTQRRGSRGARLKREHADAARAQSRSR